MMTYSTVREEDIMTDYQFKSIIKMVLEIAETSDDLERVKKSLRGLLGEEKGKDENEEKD